MNFGSKLHVRKDSKKAAIAVLDNLKAEYNFQDYELKAHSTRDLEFFRVKKNELYYIVQKYDFEWCDDLTPKSGSLN